MPHPSVGFDDNFFMKGKIRNHDFLRIDQALKP